MTFNTPAENELEVSIFGPGRGECIVMHLGYGDWCMVDSCIGLGQRESVGVEYLRKLGIESVSGVRLLLATHWHDDHIRGISGALAVFTNAKFACSNALQSMHFLKLVDLESGSVQGNSGVEEFGRILGILRERAGNAQRPSLGSPLWAIENRRLLRLERQGVRDFEAQIIALSPSDGTVQQALHEIAGLIPKPGEQQRRIVNQSPNTTSVALWIEVGGRKILLGADLEHTTRPEQGWFAVLSSFQQNGRAQLIKVPHHGSPNADCPELWTGLLGAEPIAVVTPYSSGRGLPQDNDLQRISSRTGSGYCTARLRPSLPKRESSVERLLRPYERRAIDGRVGHVRVRWSATDPDADPVVELDGGAYKI
jgi:beta-lactamase superfamily II metal-dependent hydrolase